MQFTFAQTAGAVFAVATAAAAAAWYVRGEQIDLLKQQVAAYEVAQSMNLRKLSEDALSATSKLAAQLDCSKAVEDLKAKIASLESQLTNEKQLSSKRQEETDRAKSEIETLNAQIRSLFSDYQQFSLEEKVPVKLFGAKYILSVDEISSDTVSVYFNNDYSRMSVGTYKLMENGRSSCKLFLEKIDSGKRAYFSVLCEKK